MRRVPAQEPRNRLHRGLQSAPGGDLRLPPRRLRGGQGGHPDRRLQRLGQRDCCGCSAGQRPRHHRGTPLLRQGTGTTAVRPLRPVVHPADDLALPHAQRPLHPARIRPRHRRLLRRPLQPAAQRRDGERRQHPPRLFEGLSHAEGTPRLWRRRHHARLFRAHRPRRGYGCLLRHRQLLRAHPVRFPLRQRPQIRPEKTVPGRQIVRCRHDGHRRDAAATRPILREKQQESLENDRQFLQGAEGLAQGAHRPQPLRRRGLLSGHQQDG